MTWQQQAACRGNTDRFYLTIFKDLAVNTCRQCPVQTDCLTHCLATEPPDARFGIRGGLDPDQRQSAWRRQIRRARKEPLTQTEPVIVHGHETGHEAHLRIGEQPCRSCRQAYEVAHRRREVDCLTMGAPRDRETLEQSTIRLGNP